jgi:hypothetical protein
MQFGGCLSRLISYSCFSEQVGEYCKRKGTERLNPDPSSRLLALLLNLRLLLSRRRSIAFAETLPTPAIASLYEGRSQIVTIAVAAHELLCFGFTLRPLV